MKIAILGTRGIPNNYGGFEQFAEYISVGLAERGHDVTVYSPSFHPYKESTYKGVKVKHIHSPEEWMGGAIGSIFYDFWCLKDALKKEKFDILYEAGYTSVIPAYILFDIKNLKSSIVVTNMDGLEYKRTKFNRWAQKYLFWEEKMAVKHSHFLISDNLGIQDYYKERYGKDSKFLAYGADIISDYDEEILCEFNLEKDHFFLVIARLEPENNIEMVIKGYLAHQDRSKPLIIVGKTNTPHAKELLKKYGMYENIRFQGGIYDFHKLNSIRCFSSLYFHGHSVGGTNPSLLEAMASKAFIAANNNPFNKSVLGENALYFDRAEDVTAILKHYNQDGERRANFIANNLKVINEEYAWERLVDAHEAYFEQLLSK
ncbi:DUF1972 domain-containing protein [Sphingobacterium multivorum]|uniref:DUF1972 domain-containing protein n=1 Tax=Sphingobacterium multivorum TaxID=28454 RepID=UPI003DA2DB0C